MQADQLPNRLDVPGAAADPHLSGDPILRSYEDAERRIYALGGLHYIRGNSAPHFSLTMASWRRERGRWQEDSFGAAHDELIARWPDLAPLAALHLSDWHGVPMYAESNGWYWLAGAMGGLGERYHGGNGSSARSPADCLQVWADHVRIPIEAARSLCETWRAEGTARAAATGYESAPGIIHANAAIALHVRQLHASWIAEQAERWQAEADACVAALGLRYYYGDRYEAAAVA